MPPELYPNFDFTAPVDLTKAADWLRVSEAISDAKAYLNKGNWDDDWDSDTFDALLECAVTIAEEESGRKYSNKDEVVTALGIRLFLESIADLGNPDF